MSKFFEALDRLTGHGGPVSLGYMRQRGDLSGHAVSSGSAAEAELKPFDFSREYARSFWKIVFYTHSNCAASDRFRLLRMKLRGLWEAGQLKTLLVTSPLPGEGKTVTVVNLATALAEQRSHRVLVIDADMHKSTLCQNLGITSGPGLAETLETRTSPLDRISRIDPFGWYLLQAGHSELDNPTELLQPEALSALLTTVSRHFSWIVIDSPPVLVLSDAVALSHHMDRSLVVVRAGKTSAKSVEAAISLLGSKHVAGIVLNGLELGGRRAYSTYRDYKGDKALGAKAGQ